MAVKDLKTHLWKFALRERWVAKHQISMRALLSINKVMAMTITRPTTQTLRKIRKPLQNRWIANEIPEFGTGVYVAALKKHDDPHGSRSTLTSATSSLSAMRSGEWLNPPRPAPDYLAYDSGLVG